MSQLIIPENYHSDLDIRETEIAIKYVNALFLKSYKVYYCRVQLLFQ